MSTEREVLNPATGGETTMAQAIALDPEEIKKIRADKKARFARVLERGMVADRLAVENLPENLYGEWVPNDKAEIFRMQVLGFKVDDKYAIDRALHDKGDNQSIVGDCVFMICEREDKDIIDEIRREKFQALNGKPGAVTKAQGEEKEFTGQTRGLNIGPVVEESTQRQARKADLESALARANAGTVVR